jgi:hypothetical protein
MMYRIFYIMFDLSDTAYRPARAATTAVAGVGEVRARLGRPVLMEEDMNGRLGVALAALVLACGASAGAQPAHPAGPAPATVNMQSTGAESAFFDGLMRDYYKLSVAEFARGGGKVDPAAFEQKSYALFRAYATAKGASPDGLQEHLKAIPRQVVQIVKDDPKVLDSLQNFSDALVGPP